LIPAQFRDVQIGVEIGVAADFVDGDAP